MACVYTQRDSKFGRFLGLSHISFQSEEERLDVLNRGLGELGKGNIPPKALQLGEKYRKKIISGEHAPFSIQFINKKVGSGVFAQETLKRGCYIGEYVGIVRENIRTYFAPLNDYCYEYPVPDHIGRSFVIDATQGNFTRLINHSYQPNLKPIYVFIDGFYHVIFLALKEIQIGEQLCYNYGQHYWTIRGTIPSVF